MKRLAWLANGLFAASLGPYLAPQGWEVQARPVAGERFFTWDDLTAFFGFAPDALVYGDKSSAPFLLGLESYPCPTVFHCIDSHIHSWYPLYAQAFDLCCVSLGDHLPRFAAPRLDASRLLWSPPFAAPADVPREAAKTLDMVFVGKDDPALTPFRSALLARLRQRFPGFASRTGDFRAIFPTARLVLNIAEGGDMNYRLFEALGCGCALVTPRIGHGQDRLFTDGKDFFLYDQEDFEGLCALVDRLLADPARCRRVAASGLAKIDAGHRAVHRARAFADWFASQSLDALVAERRATVDLVHGRYLRPLYLHWAEALSGTPAARVYLDAARGAGPGRGRERG
ncbi:glycosyltransferase [Desulfovibrio sp. JY]|nr:glycosyltransferase [Desulfovibrio sp. JY]